MVLNNKTTIVVCPHCAAKTSLNFRLCTNCGLNLEGATALAPKTSPKVVERETICPRCSSMAKTRTSKCGVCGVSFSRYQSHSASRSVIPATTTGACPSHQRPARRRGSGKTAIIAGILLAIILVIILLFTAPWLIVGLLYYGLFLIGPIIQAMIPAYGIVFILDQLIRSLRGRDAEGRLAAGMGGWMFIPTLGIALWMYFGWILPSLRDAWC